MKKIKSLLVVTLLSTLFLQPSFAKDEKPELLTSDRNGFFLSLAPSAGYETEELKDPGYGLNVQLGAGVAEQFLVYAKLYSMIIQDKIYDYTFDYTYSGLMVKGQYFLSKNAKQSPYINGGIGIVRVSFDDGYETLDGYTAELGLGYEYRVGKKFFISPEFYVNYTTIEDIPTITPSLAFNLGWYF